VTRLRAGRPGFVFWQVQGSDFLSSPLGQNSFWGPLILLCSGYQGLSPVLKFSEREADDTSPFSGEVRNAWRHNSTISYIYIEWILIE